MKLVAILTAATICAAEEGGDGIKFSEPNKKLQRLDRMDERSVGSFPSETMGRRVNTYNSGRGDQPSNFYESPYPDYMRGSAEGRMPPMGPMGFRPNEPGMQRWRSEDSNYYNDFQGIRDPKILPEISPRAKSLREFASMPGGPGGMGGNSMMGGGNMMNGGMGGQMGGGMGRRGFMGLGDIMRPQPDPLVPSLGAGVGTLGSGNRFDRPVSVPPHGFLSAEGASRTGPEDVKSLADEIYVKTWRRPDAPSVMFEGNSFDQPFDGVPQFQYPGFRMDDIHNGMDGPIMMDFPERINSYSRMPTPVIDTHGGFPPFMEFSPPTPFDQARHMPAPYDPFSTRGRPWSDHDEYSHFPHPYPQMDEMMPRRAQKMAAVPPHHFDNMMKPF